MLIPCVSFWADFGASGHLHHGACCVTYITAVATRFLAHPASCMCIILIDASFPSVNLVLQVEAPPEGSTRGSKPVATTKQRAPSRMLIGGRTFVSEGNKLVRDTSATKKSLANRVTKRRWPTKPTAMFAARCNTHDVLGLPVVRYSHRAIGQS